MSRKSCRQNLNRIRHHRSYTMKEIAAVLKAHVRTIQAWHKAGLRAIDENDRPLLFSGKDVIQFYRDRQNKLDKPLTSDEIYCLVCRKAVKPKCKSVQLELTNQKIGNDADQIIIKGICPECRRNITRFSSTNAIYNTVWWVKLPQADKTILSIQKAYPNTDSMKGEIGNASS